MARHGERDADEIDALRVDAVGERHQDRHRKDVGAVERASNDARLAVAELPGLYELRQQRRPGVGADLHQHLRGTDQDDETAGGRSRILHSGGIIGQLRGFGILPMPTRNGSPIAEQSSVSRRFLRCAYSPWRVSWHR